MTAPTVGERVRWRHGNRWLHGHLTSITPTGELVVREDRNGADHTLPAAGVEHEERGPRGGMNWRPLTPPAPAEAKPKRRRSGRSQLGGQLALFEARP